MEKQNRETRECNFLVNQMKTLRFTPLTVPLNSGTTAGRYAWTFKDVFPKGERNTENKLGHSSCSDNMNSGERPVPFFCATSAYTLNNAIPSPACALCKS